MDEEAEETFQPNEESPPPSLYQPENKRRCNREEEERGPIQLETRRKSREKVEQHGRELIPQLMSTTSK